MTVYRFVRCCATMWLDVIAENEEEAYDAMSSQVHEETEWTLMRKAED